MRFGALAIVVGVALGGCARRMPPRATTADAERANVALADLDRGRSLVISKCGSRCHKPPLPSDHPAAAWPAAMNEMSPRAAITLDERRAIERYLIAMSGR